MRKRSGVVYSTDQGRHCPECGEPAAACRCHEPGAPAATDGIVRLQRQTKGRAGKPVVIVTGLPGTSAELKATAKQLKQKCGVGGTVEDNRIVIQGDQREAVKAELERLGYTVRSSGG